MELDHEEDVLCDIPTIEMKEMLAMKNHDNMNNDKNKTMIGGFSSPTSSMMILKEGGIDFGRRRRRESSSSVTCFENRRITATSGTGESGSTAISYSECTGGNTTTDMIEMNGILHSMSNDDDMIQSTHDIKSKIPRIHTPIPGEYTREDCIRAVREYIDETTIPLTKTTTTALQEKKLMNLRNRTGGMMKKRFKTNGGVGVKRTSHHSSSASGRLRSSMSSWSKRIIGIWKWRNYRRTRDVVEEDGESSTCVDSTMCILSDDDLNRLLDHDDHIEEVQMGGEEDLILRLNYNNNNNNNNVEQHKSSKTFNTWGKNWFKCFASCTE